MIEYLLLGLLQGITEWLPISSQGQTVLLSQLFGMELSSALDLSIWLHTGTLLAAIVYFRKDLKNLLHMERRYLLRFLVISTIFTALIGAPLYLLFVSSFSQISGEIAIAVVGLMLIVSGLIQRSVKARNRKEKETTDRDSIISGVLQGFAALPGISRSGITTSTLLFRGFSSQAALRLSFMMSIFAVAAAEIGLQLRGGFVISNGALLALVGAFITGIITIGALLKIAQKIKFWKFLIGLGVISFLPLLVYI
jgi:undecaprenyl-diphosphatase